MNLLGGCCKSLIHSAPTVIAVAATAAAVAWIGRVWGSVLPIFYRFTRTPYAALQGSLHTTSALAARVHDRPMHSASDHRDDRLR
jgi:hypothetical protein